MTPTRSGSAPAHPRRPLATLLLLGGVTAVALLIRAGVHTALGADPLAGTADPAGGPVAPLTPALLEGADRVAAGAARPREAFGHVAGVVLALASALWARRAFGVGAGWATGLLIAAYPPLLALEVTAPALVVAAGGYAAALALADGAGARGRTPRTVAAGATAGVCAGLQPALLLAVPPLVLVPAIRGAPGARRAVVGATVGVLLGLAVWLPGHAHGDLALPGTASPAGTTPVSAADRVGAVPASWGGSSREISEELTYRSFHAVNAMEITGWRPLAYLATWLPGPLGRSALPLLIGLAVLGATLSDRPRGAVWAGLAGALGATLVVGPGAGVRLLVVPPLAVLAGAGVAGLVALARQNRAGPVLWAVALAGAAAVPTLIPLPGHLEARSWRVAGERLVDEGRWARAEPVLERARELEPRVPEVYRSLARLYRATGRPAEAEGAEVQARALERTLRTGAPPPDDPGAG